MQAFVLFLAAVWGCNSVDVAHAAVTNASNRSVWAKGAAEAGMNSARYCHAIGDRFVKSFTSKISFLKESLRVSEKPLNTISIASSLSLVTKSLAESIQEDYAEHALYFSDHGNDKCLHQVSRKAREAISINLILIYEKIIDSLYNVHLRDLKKKLAQVSPAKQYVKNLKATCKLQVKAFDEALGTMQDTFRNLVRMQVDQGLLSYNSQLEKKPDFTKVFARGKKECKRFAQEAEKVAQNMKDHMFLEGLYNPYIRESSWPPIRFSFNYLADPRAVAEKLFDKRDRQFDGVAPNRADPIQFPGVTSNLPFDPNEFPSPTEKEPSWVDVAKDFLTN